MKKDQILYINVYKKDQEQPLRDLFKQSLTSLTRIISFAENSGNKQLLNSIVFCKNKLHCAVNHELKNSYLEEAA